MLISETHDAQAIDQVVAQISSYSDHIQRLLLDLTQTSPGSLSDEVISGILNGQATSALQQLVPLSARKKAGLFFTSTQLADRVAERLAPRLRTGVRLLDPACGAGNLLLACAKYFPTGDNLAETLRMWSNSIVGYDLHHEFIRATQLRLTLFAASNHLGESKSVRYIDPPSIFKRLNAGNFFAHTVPADVDCIIVNPPFGHVSAPADCQWGTGKVQAAGCFLENLLRSAPKGQHIVAILPDVLRSGTRYRKWRTMISETCSSLEIEMAGRFDEATDVDVFILHAVVGNSPKASNEWSNPRSQNIDPAHVVGDFFEVHVGPVVPHRDSLVGPTYPYIHARTAPAWQTLHHIDEERQYFGKVFSPPFVVVHRTSSPSDRSRCVATLVNIEQSVAVENHLIVLLPRDKSIDNCQLLLNVLKSNQSTEWLNERIRCRHLTVSSLRELPWFGKEPDKNLMETGGHTNETNDHR